MAHDIVLSPIVSTVVTDNKKLLETVAALNGKYTLTLDVALDTKKIDKIVGDLQTKLNKATATPTIKFDDFKGADVSLKHMSQATAEKLKQQLVNAQLLADEKRRVAIEEANSKISIAHSRAKVQSDHEEIQASKVKIQLENERIKLLRLAQQEAKVSPSDLQNKLSGKIDNTLASKLSTADNTALLQIRDGLMAVDLASGNAKIKIHEFEQQYKQLLSEVKKGSVVGNVFSINTGSTDDDFRKYIANLKQVKEEQVRITDSSKIMFGADGSQIRTVNALVTDGAGKWQKYQYAVKDVNNEVRELDKGVEDVGVSTDMAIDAMASAIVASGAMKALDKIKDVLYACVEAATEFEAAMAGVRRTVGGSDAEIGAISDGILAMAKSIPMSTTELGKVAETAGQLGIAKENVLAFTEVMAKLGTATDLTSEAAATSLAQFAAITKLDPSNYERLASTIAFMGDNTATTASNITEMSLRIASSGSVAGFTEKDIVALSAAVGGLGVGVEAGGTSISKLITMLQKAVETGKGLDDFARIANTSASEFTEMWGTSAVSALNAFIVGLSDTERLGKSSIAILDELGISEIRLTRAILALSESGGLLTKTIAASNEAWENNTALGEKSAIMYETTAAKMELLSNSTNALKMSIGDALKPMTDFAINGLTNIAQGASEFIQNNQWIVKTLTPLVAVVGTAAAGVVAYATAMKAIKFLELPKLFTSIKNASTKAFESMGRPKILGFKRCCPSYHSAQHNRAVRLIGCRALKVNKSIYAAA